MKNNPLIIVCNERVSTDEENNFFSINADLQILPDGLSKFFDIYCIFRKLKKKGNHKFNLRKIKTASNIFIFIKNLITTNDLFHKPIDITDGNIPNGNSIMLLNFSRLKMKNEAKALSNSLNGYLNEHKSLMVSSLKSIDVFNMSESNKNCTDDGCLI